MRLTRNHTVAVTDPRWKVLRPERACQVRVMASASQVGQGIHVAIAGVGDAGELSVKREDVAGFIEEFTQALLAAARDDLTVEHKDGRHVW